MDEDSKYKSNSNQDNNKTPKQSSGSSLLSGAANIASKSGNPLVKGGAKIAGKGLVRGLATKHPAINAAMKGINAVNSAKNNNNVNSDSSPNNNSSQAREKKPLDPIGKMLGAGTAASSAVTNASEVIKGKTKEMLKNKLLMLIITPPGCFIALSILVLIFIILIVIISTGDGGVNEGGGAGPGSCSNIEFEQGQAVESKIYDSLIAVAGLTKQQAAGVMGNIAAESDYNPFLHEQGKSWDIGGWGLVQWTGGRRTNVVNFMREKLGDLFDTYYKQEWSNYTAYKSIPEEVVNQFIKAEVEYIKIELEGYYKASVWEPIKATNDIQLVSDIWLNKYEIPLVVVNKNSNPSAYEKERQKRYENSMDAYNKFGQSTSANTCQSAALASGGFNLQEAKNFMQEYIDLQAKYENDNRRGDQTINDFEEPLKLYFASCTGGPLSNCSTFVEYFVGKYTTGKQAFPDGGKMVSALLANNSGFIDGGTVPKTYAIFSKQYSPYGHTGVVLGIDKDNNKIIIGEAGCGSSASWTGAHEYNLSDFTNGSITYAYTDNILKNLR